MTAQARGGVVAPPPTVIPLDELVGTALYPGFKAEFSESAFPIEPIKTFAKADEKLFWVMDAIHFGHGVVPGNVSLVEDALTRGTQGAAENVGLPLGRGMRIRLGGTHVFMSPIDVNSSWMVEWRAGRFGRHITNVLANFEQIWGDCERDLTAAHDHFRKIDLAKLEHEDLKAAIHDAHDYYARAWVIHFEVMYTLLANYLGFYQLAAELGLNPADVSRYLAGRKTKYIETDEQLWKLAARARELDVANIIKAGNVLDIKTRLERIPNGATWWRELETFLDIYGWRVEENCAINIAPWIDDPAPALSAIRGCLGKSKDHDFDAAQKATMVQRDAAIEQARSKIGSRSNVGRFNTALASCEAANFAWWNDDHNFIIDKRAQIPAHRLTKELGLRLVDRGILENVDDVFFLFRQEVYSGLENSALWRQHKATVPDRKAYYEEWKQKLPSLPRIVGTVPDRVNDPVLIEIFGLSTDYLSSSVRGVGKQVTLLQGVAASSGVVEGLARVVFAPGDLHQLQPGEILVCPGTDPEWTPVFGYIGACVCDSGGSLTHAAIISREYGVPCVVGTGFATANIKTGDRVRVDGAAGTVEVYR